MLGFGLGLNKWRRVGGGYVGLLDLFPNAAAAYSLRKLRAAYSGAAVRVRRSSDNTEQDIGFDANGDLDTTALTTFVNADVNLFTSDYSSGGVAEPTRNNFTVTIDETKDGKTECLKAVWDGTSPSQLFKFNFLPIEQGVTFDISAEFYLEGFTSVRMGANGNAGDLNFTTNEWATYTQTITVNNTSDDFAVTLSGGTNGSTIWLKNLVITQTTADGLVSTWYDQSLSNDATQTTAANQPKIVSAGSLVTENGKAAITSETEWLSGSISLGEITAFGLFVVGKNKNTTTTNAPLVALNSDGYSAGDRWTAIRKLGTQMQFSVSDGSSISSKTFSSLNANQNLYSAFYVEGGLQNTSQNGVLTVGSNTLSGVDINSTIDFFAFNNAGSIIANNGGGLQEVVIYPSNQSANRTSIETNINNFYSIYP